MISMGQRGAFMPQRATDAGSGGFGGSRTVGQRGDEFGGDVGGDYNARVQRHLAQLRGEPVPAMAGGRGVIGIGGARPGVIGFGQMRSPQELNAAFPDAGERRITGPIPRRKALSELNTGEPYFGTGGLKDRTEAEAPLLFPAFSGRSSSDPFEDVWR